NTETKHAVDAAVDEIDPDIALMLWRHDHHDDHVVASQLSSIALRQVRKFTGKPAVRPPLQIYHYDNGPRHTIGFEPDTFVDVSGVWPQARQWLGKVMALVRNEPYNADKPDKSQQTKEAIARYRGITCGVRYAEALKAMSAEPRDIL